MNKKNSFKIKSQVPNIMFGNKIEIDLMENKFLFKQRKAYV